MKTEAIAIPVQTAELEVAYIGRHRMEAEIRAQAVAGEQTHSSWRDRLHHIAGRAALTLALACGATGAGTVLDVQPAGAHTKTIGSCKGPLWGLLAQQTCVKAVMGEKDFNNHREWVGNVEVSSPDAGPGFLEIWGDGFYKSRNSTSDANWDINKWVASGTNICGAGTDSQGFRQIVCFKISA